MSKSQTTSVLPPKLLSGLSEAAKARGARRHTASAEPLPSNCWDFVRHCVTTFDEAAAGTGQMVSRAFPDWPYLRYVCDFLETEKFARIDKSGQVMVSWCVLARALYKALTLRGFRMAYFCQTQTKAEGHLESRLYRAYNSIPGSFNKPHAEFAGGQFLVYHDGSDKLPTAFIITQAAEQKVIDCAAEKMRSETWTEAYLDEPGFYRNLVELVNGLIPRCQGLIVAGTPNGKNYFHTLGFGDINNPSAQAASFEQVGAEPIAQGIWRWRRNGFAHLRVHYSAHPERDPATLQGVQWVQEGKSRMPTRLWDREQEISYDVAAGLPVFCDTERVVEETQEIRGWLKFFGAWDPGFLWPFSYVIQVEPFENSSGKHSYDVIHVLHEFVKPNTEIYGFGSWVKAERERLFGGRRHWTDYGDDTSKHRTETGQTAKVLADMGITILSLPTGPGGIAKGNALLQQFISAGHLEIDPNCKYLLSALRSGYVRDEEGNPVSGMAGHPYCDAVDALRYFVVNMFGRVMAGIGWRSGSLFIQNAPKAQPCESVQHYDPNSHPANYAVPNGNYYRYGGPTSLRLVAETHTDRLYQPKYFDWRKR